MPDLLLLAGSLLLICTGVSAAVAARYWGVEADQ